MRSLITLLITVFLGLSPAISVAANFPIEITNIKPAGTGSPAIPASNRIFRAYPGIEYNIRAAVVGGLYPFTFSLSGQPEGMTVDSKGVITWTNPQANAGPITLSVTDSEGNTVTGTWSITVGTTGFYFIDANAASNGTGTLASPFNSISNMVTGTGASHLTDILYWRGGNYTLPSTGTSCSSEACAVTTLTDNSPYTWIGFPGETATISGGGTVGIRTYKIWYDNLSFTGFNYHGIEGQGNYPYQTVRRCNFSNLVATRTSTNNSNEGYLFLNGGASESEEGYGFVIQDNDFGSYTGGVAVGSLYSITHSLIEDNNIHDGGGGGTTGLNTAIAPKDFVSYTSIRHNKVVSNTGFAALGNYLNSIMANTHYLDISFNYFNVGSATLAHEFFQRSDKPQSHVYYYHNTLVGYLGFDRIDGSTCVTTGTSAPLGDIKVNNNVLVQTVGNVADWSIPPLDGLAYHPWAGYCVNTPQNCVTVGTNLVGPPTDNLIDSNGLLTNSSYVGTYGWEVGTQTQKTQGTSSLSPLPGRYATKQTVTITTTGSTVLTCTGAAPCTPASEYTAPVPVYPDDYLCTSTDGGTAVCGQYRFPVRCH